MADLRSTRNELTARIAATAAVVALAVGGKIVIVNGAQVLWESPTLPSPAFNVRGDGAAVLTSPQQAEILVTGDPNRYEVLSASQEILWSGSVGNPADGNQYNLEVSDTEFVQGALLTIKELVYEVKERGN